MKTLFTENEKRIVTLLAQCGTLTKKELAERGDISWATVVKALSRLEKAQIVCHAGITSQPDTTGKDPSVYELSGSTPLALGVDVAYGTTTIMLTNLRHVVLAQQNYATPTKPTPEQLQAFLTTAIVEFLEKTTYSLSDLAGIGIGVPLWLATPNHGILTTLATTLSSQLGAPVRIENNVRSYAMYKKWIGKAFGVDNFILITIRNGIGTSIFYQGDFIRGTHGMAGELSHLPVVENGALCRCGKTGCLGTVVNQDVLYQHYVRRVLQNQTASFDAVSEDELRRGMRVLFSLAKEGHPEAVAIVRQTANYLGMGIAALLLLFDIPTILLTADFGIDGDALIPLMQAEVNRRILEGQTYSMTYYPLEQLGFAQGAALLILRDYLAHIEERATDET